MYSSGWSFAWLFFLCLLFSFFIVRCFGIRQRYRFWCSNILFGALKRQISVLPYTVPPLKAFDMELHAVVSSCFCLSDSLFDSLLTNKKNVLPNEGAVRMDNEALCRLVTGLLT